MPPNIVSAVPKKLHLQRDHPLDITRRIIESRFPSPEYDTTSYNSLFPVVSTQQNFDSLGFQLDHPGRSRTDTYYVNRETVLRTHTSAHQVDVFRENRGCNGFLVSADVYRRDAIDRSHYPVFHQTEGARLWDRLKIPSSEGGLAEAVSRGVLAFPKHDERLIHVEDSTPTIDAATNPLQTAHHSAEEVEAISAHLKRTLEGVVLEIFARARDASFLAAAANPFSKHEQDEQQPLQVRWVPAYFPFTSPSWELEVFWDGDWLELLGCGVVKQELLLQADAPSKLGWAFGLGLERIAMLLFSIPDIRLFWSSDPRFLGQFTGLSEGVSLSSGPAVSSASTSSSSQGKQTAGVPVKLPRYVSFSKHPACYKDVAFWLPSSSSSPSSAPTHAPPPSPTPPPSRPSPNTATSHLDPAYQAEAHPAPQPNPGPQTPHRAPPAAPAFHVNDMMELVRSTAESENVEDVTLVDRFVHPRSGRTSLCYRVNYRRLDRTLTNDEANSLHERVRRRLVLDFGVELR